MSRVRSIKTPYTIKAPRLSGLIRLDILVHNVKRIIMNKVFSRLDHVSHQGSKSLVGVVHMLDLNLQQRACFRIQSRFPELFGVHFAKPFVALNGNAFFAGRHNRVNKTDRTDNFLIQPALANLNFSLGKIFAAIALEFVQRLRFLTFQNHSVNHMFFFHAAQSSVEQD